MAVYGAGVILTKPPDLLVTDPDKVKAPMEDEIRTFIAELRAQSSR